MNVSLVRQWAGTDRYGTSILGLVRAAEKIGMDANAVMCSAEGVPALASPFIAHYRLSTGSGHYVVVRQVNSEQCKIMDPADGRFHTVPIAEFLSLWSGVAVELQPNERFIHQQQVSISKRLIGIIAPQTKLLVTALLCSVIYTVAAVGMTVYLQQVVDLVLDQQRMDFLVPLSLAMLSVILFQAFAGFAKGNLLLKCGQAIDRRLIMGYFKHVLHLPKMFHDQMRTGEIMSRIGDAARINVLVSEVLLAFVIDALMILLSISLMLVYNWRMGVMMLLILPLYMGLYLCSDRINMRWQHRILQEGAQLDGRMTEAFYSAATIKQLSLERYMAGKVSLLFENLLRSTVKSSRYHLAVFTATDLTTRLFTILITWIGCNYVMDGGLSKGELLSYFAMMSYFTAPAISMMGAGKSIRETMIACERLFDITDLQPEYCEGDIKKDNAQPGEILFRDVTFRYGSQDAVVDHFNMLIPTNTITGIKGDSGMGKTTLISLLLGLYEPEAGVISIGGLDINNMDRASLRQLIAVVPQHTDLFNSTILENICLDDAHPDMNSVVEIADCTGLLDFTNGLPLGMNTMIVEQGNNLSGGQKQKISIARALYRNSPILVLDEPTASLDALSEWKIMQTIDWYRNKGNTVIIISHSDTALKNCDNIVILKK